MPIDEKKLRGILSEHDKDFKRQVGLLQGDLKREVGQLAEATDRRIGVAQEDFKRHVGVLAEEMDRKFEETHGKIEAAQEDTKRHVGVLLEENDRKFDLVLEGQQGLSDKMDSEFASIRKEIEELRILLFRKADVERLEAAEKRLNALEKHVLRK